MDHEQKSIYRFPKSVLVSSISAEGNFIFVVNVLKGICLDIVQKYQLRLICKNKFINYNIIIRFTIILTSYTCGDFLAPDSCIRTAYG